MEITVEPIRPINRSRVENLKSAIFAAQARYYKSQGRRDWDILTDLKDQAGQYFAEIYGLRISRTRFSLSVLRDRKMHGGGSRDGMFIPIFPYLDHCSFYRDERKRAVAVVSQPYLSAHRGKEDLVELMEEKGLDVCWPEYFSWYNPGVTALVMIIPKKPSDQVGVTA